LNRNHLRILFAGIALSALAIAWGDSAPAGSTPPTVSPHWAFVKPVEPKIPSIKDSAWVQSPVDAFVLAKLEEKGLEPAPRADARTLVRRAYFDLIGLPPTPQEADAFEADKSPDAFAKLVDKLLADPRYGERWARYWLDVARYSDTKGYVFQEERRYPFAYTYRDYVIRAFNDDKPYDRFLIEQIAADQLPLGDDKRPLAAMGFLTLGRRFINVKPDIIDDRMDVVCRGMMALTVGCARCHNHKFDPIPTADYYSLYAIFNNSPETKDMPLIGKPERTPEVLAFETQLATLQAKVDDFLAKKHAELTGPLRSAKVIAADLAATRLDKVDRNAFLSGVGPNPYMVSRWKTYLNDANTRHDPIFTAWQAYAAIPATDFGAKAAAVTEALSKAQGDRRVNPLVLKVFAGNPPASLQDVAERYGKLLAEYDKPDKLPDGDAEALRQALRGNEAAPNVPLADTQHLFKRDSRDELTKLNKKIDEFKATNPSAPPRAMTLEDSKTIEGQHVFIRGNPGNQGQAVKPHFLSVLGGSEAKPFTHGSGRLELAEAVASKDNPLTARVFVNRAWLHHFGLGIVRTPSDFGMRSDPPTHPELLDYLALRFMEDGWSIKKLQRRIMLTSTYQMSSDSTPEADLNDAQNLYLSHFNRQRLDFEATRDAILAVGGKMDMKMYGRSVDITAPPFSERRSVYAYVDRQNLPGLFRNFDFASPDATCPRRFVTTVPQQALFMMNSPIVVEQAKNVLQRPEIASATDPRQKIEKLYRLLFQRVPAPEEISLGTSFIATEEQTKQDGVVWRYGYGEYDESAQRMKTFTPFANFTGQTWQSGPKLPDPKTSYVSLTAAGGHPGDDAQHAAVRRWTSPIDGVVSISGTLAHHEKQGDGVHARIVSSRSGELASWNVFQSEAQTAIDRVEVKKGDTIDFVVDCRSGPLCDSFAWAPVVRVANTPGAAGNDAPETWNAATNFGGPEKAAKSLSSWEKYVQVLLESNEFVFVD
jgi:hypothetical protein